MVTNEETEKAEANVRKKTLLVLALTFVLPTILALIGFYIFL